MTWVYHATPEIDAKSEYPAIITVNVVFTVIAILCVALRFAIRSGSVALDEWVTLVTLLFDVIYNILCIVQTRYGLGLSLADRPKQTAQPLKVLSYAGKPFYQFGIAGFKLALCVSYLRLTEGADKRTYRRVIWTVGIASTLFHFAFMLIVLFWCIPLEKNIHANVPGYCLPFGPVNYTMASITVVCDLIIFFLPIPLFLSLSLTKRAKLALCFVFGLGIFTTMASIVRIGYLHEVVDSGNNSTVVMLGTLEFNVGIIVSCVPFLRPLFSNMRKWRERSYGTEPQRNYAMNTISKSGAQTQSAEIDDELVKDTRRHSITESEENILEPRRDMMQNPGIVKTQRFDVSSDDAS
ncbi:hypothetical protein AAFC00_004517 [Neodothiora populina]|uniref:Rhodopsin domain-containing protein n=1 Tax=Neodothiora populina TaxID=2781224 RepID=A0ABR3P2G6_9PEZI